jgi:[ribosomal protein S5]-alanine N-acetyltransferase
VTPLTRIGTARLVLRASDPALAPAVAAFYQRTRAAHARWNPPQADTLFTVEGQRERLAQTAQAIADGVSAGWWLCLRDDQSAVIGQTHLSQISRSPFCNAMIGYAIDPAHEGHGLMHEALQAVLADAFGRLGLHRVQANVLPENARSLALLERLGFEREGLAREYLFIDGAWRDHVLTALRALDWPADRAPPA